ncbi:hypothetical protein TPE_2807 [Treponema pedis str. T A4]|uniref:Uncharacterized protein n=1 Tax=Treponema pedis str. T A4 TaxID=1291379 RepID=S6A9B4_9SPIR|nr:hypothetical protein TPE_2807 [Treponema pedis str. T A4]
MEKKLLPTDLSKTITEKYYTQKRQNKQGFFYLIFSVKFFLLKIIQSRPFYVFFHKRD